ncbi:MAG TPA: hypothetical protein G4N94_07645 [Caldilineae bacterium]|nr:hypothetical protein [Caldilineae bacterium]
MVPNWVLKSKLQPPLLPSPTLLRERIFSRLRRGLNTQYTLVQAGAGYGKSTTVTAFLQERPEPSAWYSLDESDLDPLIFSSHLSTACATLAPDVAVVLSPLLQQAQSGGFPWTLVIDGLNNHLSDHLQQDVWLVLDDLHIISGVESSLAPLINHFLAYVPPHLHIILITRSWVDIISLTQARARSQLLVVDERELAFTSSEIDALFRQRHAIPLRPEHIQRLSAETEGWVMALQLLAAQLRGLSAVQIDATLADLPRHLDTLFDYLTESVIRRQSPALEDFLYQTAILRHLQAGACDAIRRTHDSVDLLAELHDAGLCLVQINETTYRHHYLVHEFLQRQLRRDAVTWRRLNRRAAVYFASKGNSEESVYHSLQAGDHEAAALQIAAIADTFIQSGRFNTLTVWLDQLPEAILDDQPDLRIIQGDVFRLTCAYDDALQAYRQADSSYADHQDILGRSLALESQALVYIDTVRPAPAESLLKQALRVLKRRHPAESARLLRLLAENAVNRGRPTLASRWYAASQQLGARPDIELEARILLRSGRLDAAQDLLGAVEVGTSNHRPARTHRERSLLLAYLNALMGDAEAARSYAENGLALARRLNSPFTEAVALMRLGNAWQLPPLADTEKALEYYQRSIQLTHVIGVRRGEAEPQFGLALLHAFGGRPLAALVAAERSLQIAGRAGDAWVGGLARLAHGIAFFLQGEFETAGVTLEQALTEFETCSDPFAATLAHLWLSLLAFRANWPECFRSHAAAWIDAAGNYPFLLLRPTLFGPRDPQELIPMLIRARDAGIATQNVHQLLDYLGLPDALSYHPGYTLRVQMFGPFRVRRGGYQVANSEWRRKKARRLLQLFLVHRGRYLQREQIIERLWPDIEPAAAENQFKVTLNALQHVLEPERRRSAPPFIIRRRDTAYGLNPAAAIDSDVFSFERVLRDAKNRLKDDPMCAITLYRQALNLYGDGFLPDAIYEEWTNAERQRLQALYLHSAEALARLLLHNEPDEAITWCERILAIDPGWEPAYRLAMRAYAVLSQRHLLARIYQRYIDNMKKELDLPPAPETIELYLNLVHGIWQEEKPVDRGD